MVFLDFRYKLKEKKITYKNALGRRNFCRIIGYMCDSNIHGTFRATFKQVKHFKKFFMYMSCINL